MRRIWDLDQETFNLVAGAFLLAIIIFLLWCFDEYNKSYVVVTDTNVHVIDKYHEREYCNGEGYCDPEHFVVVFDNHQTVNLKNKEPWSQVVINSLWRYHQEQGRLWIIKKEAYPL